MNNTVNYAVLAVFGFLFAQFTSAQSDTIKIEGKGQKRVIVLNEGEETKVVLKDESGKVTIEMESEGIAKKDSGVQLSYEFPEGKLKVGRKKNYSVNILSDFSFGFASAVNNQVVNIAPNPYALPEINDGFNFSMNFLKQEVNLVKHQLFLTTAFGINNFYYNLNNKKLAPVELPSVTQQGDHVYLTDSLNTYKRNRLDSRFFSIPLMLKWKPNTKKKHGRFAVAAGVELNFNNRVYSKLRIDEARKNLEAKTQIQGERDGLTPSYIVRVQYGSLGVFGRVVQGGVFDTPEHSGNVYSFGLATKF